MIKISNKSQCSGCSACYSICGRHAISMVPDTMGFLYPVVDNDKCVDCGLCDKVCAFNEQYKTNDNYKKPIVFGARQLDIHEVEKSRSGGIFAALSDLILEEGGVIYGAALDKSFRVEHKRAIDKQQRDEFRGSKYVQSIIGDTFSQVAQDLKTGLKVLYSGTPCQIAGLHSFLSLKKIDQTNLLLCDIVCHGVPSPNIWQDYLNYIRKKEGQEIISVNFRDKHKFGWAYHRESFKLSDTNTYTYTYTFYQHIMFRLSCHECPYTNLRRTGDITLADFWGWEKTDSAINKDDKGVSLVFVNTGKGKNYFSAISDKLIIVPTTIDKCMQPNLQHPSSMHPSRLKFEEDYANIGFEKVMKKYALMGWKFQVNNKLHYINGRLKRIKNRLHKIMGQNA